jgi:hypothetical protein
MSTEERIIFPPPFAIDTVPPNTITSAPLVTINLLIIPSIQTLSAIALA